MIILPVALNQLSVEVLADFGEHRRQVADRQRRQYVAAVFRDEDQMNMRRKNTVFTGTIILHPILRPTMIRGMMLTFKYRVKDATVGKHLNRFARASNQVCNYCCQIQRQAESRWKAGRSVRWPSAFDLIKLCTGSAAELGLHSDTVQTICRQFAASRDLHKRCPRFRASGGAKRALGWVPFIPRALKIDGAHVVYLKRKFHFWKSREIPGEFKAGSFVQDARGRWYVTFQCEIADELPTGTGEIGIDLGLRTVSGALPNAMTGPRSRRSGTIADMNASLPLLSAPGTVAASRRSMPRSPTPGATTFTSSPLGLLGRTD